MTPKRLRRLLVPAKRLGAVALLFDAGASCVLLGLQFRGISLGASPLLLGMLSTVPSLLGAPASLLSGHLSDRWGRRTVDTVALSCCLVSWLGMRFATSTTQLLLLAALTGVGFGFLWAPLAAWMSDLSGGSSRLLNRYLGIYNFAWAAGLMVGPLLAGSLWEIRQDLVFLGPVGLLVLCLGLVQSCPAGTQAEAEEVAASAVPRDRLWLFVLLAWCGGFAASYGRGVQGGNFPRLATDLGFSALTIGQIGFAAPLGETLVFMALRLTKRWQLHPGLQVATMALTCGAMVVTVRTTNPWVFAGCFGLMGGALGMTYAAALQAAMQMGEKRGRLAGYNELLFTCGLVCGPACGGLAAQHLSLRWPLALSATVCVLALFAQLLLWAKSKRLAGR